MNVVDKISKEVLNLFEYSKDLVRTNVTTAVLQEKSSLSEDQLNRLLKLIDTSIIQGYQTGLTSFQKSVTNTLNESKNTKK